MFFMDPDEMDRHQQAHTVAAHDVKRFFDELTEEQLRVLGMILDGIAVADNPTRIAGHLGGRVLAMRQLKFGICPACNENHDRDLENIAHEGTPETPLHVDARRRAAGNEVKFLEIGDTGSLSPAERALMKEYNIDDLREEETMRLVGFVCLECGMRYSTIQDRMMKPPGVEGCSGCIQKAKFG